MTGELNYDDVFHGEQTTYHYLAAQCLFALFTILISMILFNLLIGLAVTEIQVSVGRFSNFSIFCAEFLTFETLLLQNLKARSHLSELKNMLKEIFLLECFGVRLRDKFGIHWLLHRMSIINENIEASKDLNAEDPSEKMEVVERL